jgi:hypothetical protein
MKGRKEPQVLSRPQNAKGRRLKGEKNSNKPKNITDKYKLTSIQNIY